MQIKKTDEGSKKKKKTRTRTNLTKRQETNKKQTKKHFDNSSASGRSRKTTNMNCGGKS